MNLIFPVAVALMVAFVWQSPAAFADGQYDELSIDVSNCNGQPVTPACASWLLSLCEWRQEPELCGRIGLKGVVFLDEIPWKDGKVDLPDRYLNRVGRNFPSIYLVKKDASFKGVLRRPGVIEIRRQIFEGRERNTILGIREVTSSRFDRARLEPHWVKDPERYISTHEVIIGPHFPISHFFRKEGNNWVLSAWDSGGVECGYHDLDADYIAVCTKHLPILDWFELLLDELWEKYPIGSWKAEEFIEYFAKKSR